MVKKYDYLLISIATVLVIISGGGLRWIEFIAPLILLLVYDITNIKKICTKNIGLVSLVFLALGTFSIVGSCGDIQNSLYEYERLTCFVAALFAATCTDREKALKSVVIGALFTAIIGLLAYCNIIRTDGFIFNDRYIWRLQSFLKYANVTAVLLGCAYFICLHYLVLNNNKHWNYVSSIILIAFYLTLSKAAIPIFIIIGTVLICKCREHASVFVGQNFVCMIFSVLTVAAGFFHIQFIKLLLIVLGVALSGRDVLCKIKKTKNILRLWFAAILMFCFAVILIMKTKNIEIMRTLFGRFDYYKDAFKLIVSHPLTGIGPGAWNYVQYSVQSSQYGVVYIHSGILQIMLDYGVVFFVLAAALTAVVITRLIKSKKYISLCVLSFILIHGAVDIDLSYAVILILTAFVFGDALSEGDDNPAIPTMIKICSCLACVLAIAASSLYMTAEYFVRSAFENAYTSDNNAKALSLALKLEKICPFDSKLQISIAALGGDDVYGRIEKAEKLSPYDKDILAGDIEFMIANGEPSDTVFEKIKHYIALSKLQETTYADCKSYIKKMLDAGKCDNRQYNNYLDYIENERKANGVTDRNEIIKQGG